MIIGLTGKARSGKDTVADYLIEKYGFKRVSFADPVKEFAHKHFHIPKNQLYENKTEFSRRILQGIGDGIREEINKYIWIKKAFEKINENDNIVISDVRYLNEEEEIKHKKGIIWKIERNDKPNIEYNPNHRSEMEMDKINPNIVINNNKMIENLYTEIDFILKGLL